MDNGTLIRTKFHADFGVDDFIRMRTTAANKSIAASRAGRSNNRLQFNISSGSGGRNSIGLFVVIL